MRGSAYIRNEMAELRRMSEWLVANGQASAAQEIGQEHGTLEAQRDGLKIRASR